MENTNEIFRQKIDIEDGKEEEEIDRVRNNRCLFVEVAAADDGKVSKMERF